ncbi:hypothetical protein [Streptomyces sp. NBC_00572]|uniref:hypothetical protein n=1 Tax=Streptomyces sp. NBC_00572 TaxID=2903664 RepID=UPI0022568454|nr:hypothetical protein [Streptomyces sp. NBC_00572]MCX4983190.1 hypothetical protein [Streptomyces sp. NBC_00572]
MFRSFRRIGVLGVCAVAAGAFSAVAAVPASAAEAFEFTVYAQEVPGDQGDESAPPPGLGDSFAFADDLFRSKGGEQVGRDGVTCTVVRVGDPGDFLCVGTFVLVGEPAGQVTGQVMLTIGPSDEEISAFDIAVTGGTGDFEGARGTIRSTQDGDYSRMEFHITD